MSHLSSEKDECFILIKAQPHRSSNYFETVCCAGVGRDSRWRRQYPVPFRILASEQKFSRWQWISYDFSRSKRDLRRESQKVIPESIVVAGTVPKRERAHFLNPLIRESLDEADARDESLTLIRPDSFELSWKRKSDSDLYDERIKHARLASQLSIFDKTAKPLDPCPFEFSVRWSDQNGKQHRHVCDDWETAQALRNFSRRFGESKALITLQEKYNDYFDRGLVLAFSTHSRRNKTFGSSNQWLLVGMIRIDRTNQPDMFI